MRLGVFFRKSSKAAGRQVLNVTTMMKRYAIIKFHYFKNKLHNKYIYTCTIDDHTCTAVLKLYLQYSA